MIPARRQVADQVDHPEDWVIPEGEEGPTFPPPEGGHRDHGTEEAHADRRRTMARRYCSSELRTTMTMRPNTSVARPLMRSAIQLTLKRRLSCRAITARS